ncbi:hypothetical protein CSUI_007941, partial [Cystoisospora suis]
EEEDDVGYSSSSSVVEKRLFYLLRHYKKDILTPDGHPSSEISCSPPSSTASTIDVDGGSIGTGNRSTPTIDFAVNQSEGLHSR